MYNTYFLYRQFARHLILLIACALLIAGCCQRTCCSIESAIEPEGVPEAQPAPVQPTDAQAGGELPAAEQPAEQITALEAEADKTAVEVETAVETAESAPDDELTTLAKEDHIGLLEMAIDKYRRQVKDYTGTMVKQEAVGGVIMAEQIIDFKFKEDPYSVLMTWKKNPGGADKLLYVEGKNDGMMIVHPTGMMRWMKSVRRRPDSPDAMKANLNPCDEFGFYNAMNRLLRDYETGKRQNDLEMSYLGEKMVDQRKCLLLERILPEKPIYRYEKLITAMDAEYLVPVFFEATFWDGRLHSRYSFINLNFNTGLKDSDFTPQANGL